MSKVIIIGNGPAGISASLYTQRGGVDTVVIGKDAGTIGKAEKIDNYYGFIEPISGKDLFQNGIKQAQRIGVEVVEDEVISIAYDGDYIVKTKGNEYKANAIILATGTSRKSPKVKGLNDFEGRGISYCAVCDAFFYKGKNVAVLGDSDYALNEANELINVTNSVTILTNGREPKAEFPKNMNVITKEIDNISGENVVSKVNFVDGTNIEIDGIFVAVGVAGTAELAKKLGVATENKKIIIDENMTTNIPGLFAAGDCTGGMLQVAKAVYDGAKAGTEALNFIRRK